MAKNVKVIEIKADTMDEAMDEIVKSIKEELCAEEDQDCKDCETKKECEKKQAEFQGKEILNAVYALTRVLLKEEHKEELDKQYEKFIANENVWVVGHYFAHEAEKLCEKMFTVLNDEDLAKLVLELSKKAIELKLGN